MSKRDEWTYPHKGSELLGFATKKLQQVKLAKEQCLEDHKDAQHKREHKRNKQPTKTTKLPKPSFFSLLSPCFWIDLFCPPEDPELEATYAQWIQKHTDSFEDLCYTTLLAKYSNQIDRLNVWIYEFTRDPNKEFVLNSDDVLFFGLTQKQKKN